MEDKKCRDESFRMVNECGHRVYFGNRPTKEGWLEVRKCSDDWMMYVLDGKMVKLVSIPPREHKANFMLKWSSRLGRFDKGDERTILEENYPKLLEEAEEVMRGL